jgi:hypothetical protein
MSKNNHLLPLRHLVFIHGAINMYSLATMQKVHTLEGYTSAHILSPSHIMGFDRLCTKIFFYFDLLDKQTPWPKSARELYQATTACWRS